MSLTDASVERFSGGRQLSPPEVIDASVTIKDGQTVVLGSGRPRAEGRALILVM